MIPTFCSSLADPHVAELRVAEVHRPRRVVRGTEGAVGHDHDLAAVHAAQDVGREAERAREVGPRVGRVRSKSSSRSRAEVSPVIGPSGVTIASICAMSMRSAPPRPRIIFFTSSFATPRRLGATSVACIDALASTSTTTVRPLMRLSAARGSPSARTSSASSASCRSSERSRLSFEKRLVASLSRRIRSQSGENGTATTRRRSLRT